MEHTGKALPSTAADSRYRPDIDGLRAVAVLSVLFYHARFDLFAGGFVGVDVFFVISGFLITRLIINQVDKGTFSYSTFYIRRVRRLFPTLLVVVTSTLIAGLIIFPPEYLQRFAGAAIYALTSISNFYFMSEVNYFEAVSELKPLLHTWSLSVEEQFYLIWPICLVFLATKFPRWTVPLVLIIVAIISLVLAEIFADLRALFFFTGFRIFELAIGALMVWVIKIELPSNWLKEVLLVIGLALIAWSVFALDQNTPWPGLISLIPCTGAALVIYAGTAPITGKLLSNPVSVFIGLISYSLYLVHWPLIVFYAFTRLTELTQTEKWALVAVSIILSYVLYALVETPFRHGYKKPNGWKPAKFGLTCAMLALAIIIPASHIYANDGWKFRISNTDIETLLHNNEEMEFRSVNNFDTLHQTVFDSDQTKNILVIGDSHSEDIFNALTSNIESLPNTQITWQRFDDRCFLNLAQPLFRDKLLGRASTCQHERDELLGSGKLQKADVILISNRWALRYLDGVENGLEFLEKNSPAKILILGNKAEFPFLLKATYKLGPSKELETVSFETRSDEYIEIAKKLNEVSQSRDHVFINLHDLVCDIEDKRCKVISKNVELLYFDESHWSWAGEKIFGQSIIALPQFRSAIQ